MQASSPARAEDTGAESLAGTDAEYFTAYRAQLSADLERAGMRDAAVVNRVMAEAQAALSEAGQRGADQFSALGMFAARLIQAGIAPVVIQAATELGARYLAELSDDEVEGDESHYEASRATLQAHWGKNFEATVARIRAYVNTQLPPPLADALWEGRDLDGHRLANSPTVLLWLAEMSGAAVRLEVDKEIAELERLMRVCNSRYWKGPNAEQLRARYRDLITLRDGK